MPRFEYLGETVQSHRTEDDKERGLYRKYVALKWPSGETVHNFFLLRFDQDPFAIPALRAYAEACKEKYPQLAADLIEMAGQHEARLIRLQAGLKRLEEIGMAARVEEEKRTKQDRKKSDK